MVYHVNKGQWHFCKLPIPETWKVSNLASIHLLKVNNRNILHCSSIFTVDFEHILHLAPVF